MTSINAKRYAFNLIKLIISVFVIALISKKLKGSDLLNQIQNIGFLYFIYASIFIYIAIFFQASRWKIALLSLGYEKTYTKLFKETWIGSLYNQILPSSIGGDAVRIFRIKNTGVPLKKTTNSIIIDRLFGLLSSLFLSALALPVFLDKTTDKLIVIYAHKIIWFILILLLITLFFMYMKNLLPQKLNQIFEYIIHFIRRGNNRKNIMYMFALSLLLQLCLTFSILFLSLNLNLEIDLLTFALCFQLINLISMIPISFAGWGVREGAFILILGALNVPIEKSAAISVMYGCALLAVSLPALLISFSAREIN